MAEEKKSIEISYKANISDLKKKLEQLPDITKDEAKKMVSALDRQLKQAERASKRAAEAHKKAAKASSKASKQARLDFDKMTTGAAALAGSFAVMGAAVVQFSQDVADLTNELTDASAKSGIAIETLAGLRLAAEGSGLEFSNLEGGLIKFQSSMLDASRGSKELADSFSRLGVDVKDSNGNLRDADKVFNEAVKSLGKMENTTERNATAMKLFGKAGGASLIQSGALDNLENMTELAREFGVAIDEDAIGAMGDFQRKMAEFDVVAQGTMQRLLASMTGTKSGITPAIEMATDAIVFFGSVAETVLDSMSGGFQAVALGAKGVASAFEGDFAGAVLLTREATEKLGESALRMNFVYQKAAIDVKKFNETSENTNATLEKTATSTEDAGNGMNGYGKSIKNARLELEGLDQILGGFFEANISLGDQVRDRITPEYEKQKNAILEIGIELERNKEKIEDEVNALFDAVEARGLSVQEQAQLLLLTEELQEAERLVSENRKAETIEMQELVNQMHQDRLHNIQEALDLEIEAQEAIRDQIIQTADLASSLFSGIGEVAMNIAGENEEAQQRAFEVNQAAAMADVVFGTARAIAAAMVLPPGLRGAAIAGAIATGGVQWAKVATQEPPKYHMGGTAPDEVNATLLRGEAVLSRQAVQSVGGAEGVRKIEEGSTGLQNAIIIQPFKHLDRYIKMQNKRKPRMIGSGGY